jgi:DNA polymerase-4
MLRIRHREERSDDAIQGPAHGSGSLRSARNDAKRSGGIGAIGAVARRAVLGLDRRMDEAAASRRAEERSATPARKIIHVDMDAFYASVEQRDNPDLRGRPVAVGGARERGVVAAASYEARKFGVRSAMPSLTARRLCPELVFVPPRFEVYREVSRSIRRIFAEYTPIIEPLALDEAYLDVTENLKGIASATRIAEEIRAKIRAETGLTASAGVSYNKFLAKLASDHKKPDGLFVVTPRMGRAFVASLPVERFHGVGPATAARMHRLGIATGLDLEARSLPFLQQHFGKAGAYYYGLARGIDERPVRADRIRKSIGAEVTFAHDLFAYEEARAALLPIVARVWAHCEGARISGRTVTLKVKYADFRQITRRHTGAGLVATREELEGAALALLGPLFPAPEGVRLLGVTLSTLGERRATPADPQLSLAV